MKLIILIFGQIFSVYCNFLSEIIPTHLKCLPYYEENMNITNAFFENSQVHFIEAPKEGYKTIITANPCPILGQIKTVHTLEFFYRKKSFSESPINPYKTTEGFIFNGTTKVFRTKFLPAMSKWNPLAKCLFVTSFETHKELEMTLNYAWQKFRICNVLVYLRNKSGLTMCAFSPFEGLNGTLYCFKEKSTTQSYKKIETFFQTRNKNSNKYPIKVNSTTNYGYYTEKSLINSSIVNQILKVTSNFMILMVFNLF